ncbi:hypothetical protein LINGRAHAP2_LOCUS25199 [Linum grandiflorum]
MIGRLNLMPPFPGKEFVKIKKGRLSILPGGTTATNPPMSSSTGSLSTTMRLQADTTFLALCSWISTTSDIPFFVNAIAVLGKVRDFLGVFSEANQQLQRDSKVNCTKYDIEALTGNESQLIEMDLMLGVAELRNQQALDAAEAALAGAQPLTLDGSESDSSDESGSENSNDDNEKNSKDASMLGEDGSSRVNKRRPKKQPKIVEMPGSSM